MGGAWRWAGGQRPEGGHTGAAHLPRRAGGGEREDDGRRGVDERERARGHGREGGADGKRAARSVFRRRQLETAAGYEARREVVRSEVEIEEGISDCRRVVRHRRERRRHDVWRDRGGDGRALRDGRNRSRNAASAEREQEDVIPAGGVERAVGIDAECKDTSLRRAVSAITEQLTQRTAALQSTKGSSCKGAGDGASAIPSLPHYLGTHNEAPCFQNHG